MCLGVPYQYLFIILNIFQADSGNNVIRRINVSTGEVTTLAGHPQPWQPWGYADGVGPNATFRNPSGVAMDAAGAVGLVVSGGDSTACQFGRQT